MIIYYLAIVFGFLFVCGAADDPEFDDSHLVEARAANDFQMVPYPRIGKRGDEDKREEDHYLSAIRFGKRYYPTSLSYGKRRYLSAIRFGKRNSDDERYLSTIRFGKRDDLGADEQTDEAKRLILARVGKRPLTARVGKRIPIARVG